MADAAQMPRLLQLLPAVLLRLLLPLEGGAVLDAALGMLARAPAGSRQQAKVAAQPGAPAMLLTLAGHRRCQAGAGC